MHIEAFLIKYLIHYGLGLKDEVFCIHSNWFNNYLQTHTFKRVLQEIFRHEAHRFTLEQLSLKTCFQFSCILVHSFSREPNTQP
jgi:hypothetical protein